MANILPQLNTPTINVPGNNTPEIEKKPYKIKGKISSNSEPIKGAKIISTISQIPTFSKSDGSFTLQGLYDGEIFDISISKKGYKEERVTPFDLNKTPKDTGIIDLIKDEAAKNIDIQKYSNFSVPSLKKLTKPDFSLEYNIQKQLNGLIDTIQTILIPVVINLIYEFGVTNIENAIKNKNLFSKSCPSNIDELNKIIAKKNKLVKQLNNIYKVIDKVVNSLKIASTVLETLNIALKAIKLLPSPTPPPIPILANELGSKIEKTSKFTKSTLVVLSVVRDTLKTVITLLSFLDTLVQDCSQELGVTIENQEQINQELLKIQQEQEPEEPIITEAYGFIMDIETENTNNSLKRKRAIAKNKRGIVLLQGEWSYSSIDQILIDELVFYIQTNNLKAD